MYSIRILSIFAILAVVFYIASADSYTSKKDDDIVLLLKAGCGSSRLLLEAAKASGLTPPYKVKKGQILQLPCKLQHKMETYTNKIPIAPTSLKFRPEVKNANDCQTVCLADSGCSMSSWVPFYGGCYTFSEIFEMGTVGVFGGNSYSYVKVQVDL